MSLFRIFTIIAKFNIFTLIRSFYSRIFLNIEKTNNHCIIGKEQEEEENPQDLNQMGKEVKIRNRSIIPPGTSYFFKVLDARQATLR